jgi:hypothetical protein
MQVKDLSHPKTSKTLNESMAKKFGYKLNLDSFTYEQLAVVRDRLVDKIATFESSQNYDAVYENNEYRKDRAFLDVIVQALTERSLSPDEESKREKYVKGMKKVKGDFSKKYGKRGDEVMYATATKMAKKESVGEAMDVLRQALSETVLNEGEEEKAALIMKARDMVDKITGWLEDTASLKSESMLELVDSIRDELGSEISNQFEQKVKPALDDLYSNLETNRTALAQAVAVITGEEAPGMAAPEMPAPEGETGLEGELAATGDEFAASAPAAGGEAAAGRERRESIEYSRKLGQILNSKKK